MAEASGGSNDECQALDVGGPPAHGKPPLPPPTTMETLAGLAGNVLEWYDFAAYGYFSDVIADLFFPEQSGLAALAEAFAVYGAAFFMRPVGGVLMGWVGDKYGRKRALEISIFIMAFPTFAMGCLPTYDQVGYLATFLLVLVRLLQGLSVGGQLVSSLVFTLESRPRERWGLAGSYVFVGVGIGTLLGALVSAFVRSVLNDDQLRLWGWRFPFWCGIFAGVVGLYLRSNVREHGFTVEEGLQNPLKLAFARNRVRMLFAACLVPFLWSGGFYICFVWLAIYMADILVPPIADAFWINCAALFFSVCLFFPVAGMTSDRFGRIPVMTCGGLTFGILAPLLMYLVTQGNAILAFVSQCIFGVSLSFWGAPMMAWLVEAFPPDARLTSVAIGYNIAQALMGGTASTVATLLVDYVSDVSPGFYLSGLAIVSLIGLRFVAPKPELEEVPVEDFDAADEERVEERIIS